jgi:hypothetical protein
MEPALLHLNGCRWLRRGFRRNNDCFLTGVWCCFGFDKLVFFSVVLDQLDAEQQRPFFPCRPRRSTPTAGGSQVGPASPTSIL